MSDALMAQFFARVDASGDCWEWTGGKQEVGSYGRFSTGNTYEYAHRFVMKALVGVNLDGMTVDHLCRNRGCVNPDHLEVVTSAENVRRAPTGRKHVAVCGGCGHKKSGKPRPGTRWPRCVPCSNKSRKERNTWEKDYE